MPDNVVFLADCISSKEALDKYAVSFIYDVGAYLKTLDKVERMEAAMFVPAHADASADVKELVCYNRDKVHDVSLTVIPYSLEISSKTSRSGSAAPVSHFDTACLDLSNFFAKSSCV